jgi:DNA-binding transcriptional ArsR family regulator
MVERLDHLNQVFGSLSDPTRRDILKRLGKADMNIGQIAEPYPMSFAAVAKHVDVLLRANLVTKTRRGKEQRIAIQPTAFTDATHYLEQYRILWEQRLDALDRFLKTSTTKGQNDGTD